MLEKAPNLHKLLVADFFTKAIELNQTTEVRLIMKKAQEDYLYWDVFRHHPLPAELKPEEAWAILKLFYRNNEEESPITNHRGEKFSYSITKTLYKRLNFIDSHSAGFIQTLTDKPKGFQKEQLIISGLSEEAIASSQLEGASTERKVAKEMIYSGRKPRNVDEKMILNNYSVMKQVDQLKEFDLTEEILLDIQEKITKDTLRNPRDGGRFRTDSDDIVVSDKLTGEVVFTPQTEENMRLGLKELLKYANTDEKSNEDFTHPIIKAAIIHFWIAYLHPFPDGNGRTARAIFYWYLRKKGYWLFEYLAVSKAIKESRTQYDNAFLHTEYDDNDLTYFLLYITKIVEKSVINLQKYCEKKFKETELSKKIKVLLEDLNERQISLVHYIHEHPGSAIEIKPHQTKNGISYETARKDLLTLTHKGFLTEVRRGKKNVYIAVESTIRKLFQKI